MDKLTVRQFGSSRTCLVSWSGMCGQQMDISSMLKLVFLTVTSGPTVVTVALSMSFHFVYCCSIAEFARASKLSPAPLPHRLSCSNITYSSIF